jgi:hypothetical protein
LSEGESGEEEYSPSLEQILERAEKTKEFKEQPAEPPPAEDSGSEASSSEESGESQSTE